MTTTSEFSLQLDEIGSYVLDLLRTEEERLLRQKELLLIVYEGRTGSRQLQRRAVELSRLHSESFISEFFPSLSSALT
jgi:hypothetical protein